MAGPGDAAGMALSPLTGAMEGLSSSISKLQAVTNTATTSLDALSAAISANVARFVQLYNPAAVIRFELAVKDLNAVIGRALMPLLERFTLVIKEVGNAVAGLTPSGMKMIAVMAAVGVGLATAAVATGVFFSILTGVMVGLTVLAGALGTATAVATAGISLVAGAIAGIFTAVTTATAAAGFFGAEMGVFKSTVKEVVGHFKLIFEVLSSGFDRVMTALKPLRDALSELASAMADQGIAQLQVMVEIVANIFEILRPEIERAANALLYMTRQIRTLTASIREFFGLQSVSASGSAEGAAVRNVRFGSPEDAWREAMKASFSLGNVAGPDPAKQAVNHLSKIEGYVQRIVNAVETATRAMPGLAVAAMPTTIPGRALVADQLRQLYDGG